MPSRRPLLAGLAALTALACLPARAWFGDTTIDPSGRVVTESRQVPAFTGLGVSIPGTVVVRQGPAAGVSVEADDNLLPQIETVVEGAILHVRVKRGVSIGNRATLRVLVTGPSFETLKVAGSGDVISEGIQSRALDVSIAGSGNVKLAKLETGRLHVSIAGSGDFRAAGSADEVDVRIAGSGNVAAGKVDAKRARVSIAGSGNATVRARETLDTSILGSGDVRYYGVPAITQRIAGSGSLTNLGPSP